MHLIIPYAFSYSEGCTAALDKLQLPHLQKLLGRLSPLPVDAGDEFSLSPPHERALANTLGLSAPDGQIAWAAWHARQRYPKLVDPGSAWGWIDLCHWQVNTNHMVMSHLPLPDFSAQESADLLAAMRPYFEEDGITLHEFQPGRWLAQSAMFAGLATPSPDRVLGRNLEHWMPLVAQAAPVRRLQNEMQMLFYTHPTFDARTARGLTPVNSFWLSGTGTLPVGHPIPAQNQQPTVLEPLRRAALAEDWAGWSAAWQDIDAQQIRPLLQAAGDTPGLRLTLCGERASRSWEARPQTMLQKFKGIFDSQPLSELLKKL